MRTVEEITNEMDASVKRAAEIRRDRLITRTEGERMVRAMGKRFKFLKKIRNYLEFNPKKETLEKQRQHLMDAIRGFERPERYDAWLSWNVETPKSRKDYEKKFIKPLKDQIETLNFILNDNKG